MSLVFTIFGDPSFPNYVSLFFSNLTPSLDAIYGQPLLRFVREFTSFHFQDLAIKLKGLTAQTVFSDTRDSTCPESRQRAWKEYKCYLWTTPSDICQGIYRFPLSFLAAAARCARRLGALLAVGVVRCLLQLEYKSSATGEVLRFSFSVLYKVIYPK